MPAHSCRSACSRASSLSIKTLRAYHEAGILVPARVDPGTGYRSYTVDQLADAAVVLRLRGLDLPLEQVREVLQRRDPVHTRKVLDAHAVEMQARLVAAERIVSELQSTTAPVTHTPVHVRFDDAAVTVSARARCTADNLWAWLDGTFARIGETITRTGAVVAGARGALYEPEIADDDIEDVEAFVPVTTAPFVDPRDHDVRNGQVPAGWVAVLVHAGDYDSILDTYRTLGAWVARNARNSDDGRKICERYLVGSADTDDASSYRTEIAWPIEPPADVRR